MKQCHIKIDAIKGRGVFAGEVIKKGEIIEVCELLFLSQDEDTLEGYVFKYDDRTNVIALGNGCLYNHGRPNAQCYYDEENKKLIFEALKKISEGDEILINYGYSKEMKERFKIKT